MTYQVPQHIDTKKIFIVKSSDTQERLDAQYHREKFDFSCYHRLSEYVFIKGGKRIPKGLKYSSDLNSPYLYLRVIDLNDDNDINYRSLKRIDKSLYEALKRYEIRDNEIAFSIAGSIGKVMLVHDIPERYHLILTENCAKLIIKDNHTLLPQYLSILLNLPIVQKQVRLNYVQTTIPKLSLERIGRLMIPPIPSIKRQKNVIRHYYNALENKQIKENQAKQILDNIDNYVLGELGISMLNTHSSSLTDRIFSINFKDLDQKRLDSNYFDKKYSKLIDCIKNGKYPLVPLKDITSFISTGLTPKAGHYSDIKTNFLGCSV